ncbi:MAG: hypothetical protein H0Z39_02135 [Peptococcaceae bacterium]|nr:hypothetical protein [Peptococcaceae bacterium]
MSHNRFLRRRGYREPDLQEYLHCPVGSPRAREIKSQKAQLHSGHRHGNRNDVKLGMEYKTGRRGYKEWPWER